jgi:hypothetical protein
MFLVFLGKRGEITYQNLSLDIEAGSVTPEKGRMNHEELGSLPVGNVCLGAVELRPDGRE